MRGNRRLAGNNRKDVQRGPREILRHPRLQGWVQGRVGGGGGRRRVKRLVRSDEQASGMGLLTGVNGRLSMDSGGRGGKKRLCLSGVTGVGREDPDGSSSGGDEVLDRKGDEEAAVRAEAKAEEQEVDALPMQLRKRRPVAAGERGRPDGEEHVSVDDTVLDDDGKELHEEGLTEESAEWEGESDPDQESDA